MDRRLIFEKDNQKDSDIIKKPSLKIKSPQNFIPQDMLRQELSLPSPGEPEVVRHYTNLSRLNFSVDTNFYPLGSCTMKYNPKVNEDLANLTNFLQTHPYQPLDCIQGTLELLYNLEQILRELTGMARFSFQPCAGAHGELVGMMIVHAYHRRKGQKRRKVVVSDSSHGTNPMSAKMCGYEVVTVNSDQYGLVDIDKLVGLIDDDTAAVMLTNPNTLGLFEERILDINQIVHRKGALLYYDGANFNALCGIVKPSLMGFDIVHLNFHKTFSTPHGSGGPGAGAVGVVEELIDFLPQPLIDKKENRYVFNYNLKYSIGRVRTFYGNVPVLIKAYTYLLRVGKKGLIKVAQQAVLNANYLRVKLNGILKVASPKRCMHEVVFSCRKYRSYGCTALDVAKRLIDFGIHPPTMYFPLIVKEALMVEPTETESKHTLDRFIEVIKIIDEEVRNSSKKVKEAPYTTPVGRVDEVYAAKHLDLRWRGESGE